MAQPKSSKHLTEMLAKPLAAPTAECLKPDPDWLDRVNLPRLPPLISHGLKKAPLCMQDFHVGDTRETRYPISYDGPTKHGISNEVLQGWQTATKDLMDRGALPIMTKGDYEKLAAAVRKIRDGCRASAAVGDMTTDVVVEIVTAQLALVLAKDNPNFDSFKFAAKCKGTKA